MKMAMAGRPILIASNNAIDIPSYSDEVENDDLPLEVNPNMGLVHTQKKSYSKKKSFEKRDKNVPTGKRTQSKNKPLSY